MTSDKPPEATTWQQRNAPDIPPTSRLFITEEEVEEMLKGMQSALAKSPPDGGMPAPPPPSPPRPPAIRIRRK